MFRASLPSSGLVSVGITHSSSQASIAAPEEPAKASTDQGTISTSQSAEDEQSSSKTASHTQGQSSVDRRAITLLRVLRPCDLYDPELDWCSNIDDPKDTDSDKDSEEQSENEGKDEEKKLRDKDGKAVAKDPWNAVIGLRIYSKPINGPGWRVCESTDWGGDKWERGGD